MNKPGNKRQQEQKTKHKQKWKRTKPIETKVEDLVMKKNASKISFAKVSEIENGDCKKKPQGCANPARLNMK